MRLVVDILELLFDKLGVDLRGGDVGVAEHFLNGAEVRAVFEQVRRERVAQGVRRNVLFDLRLGLIGLYDILEALAGHALAADIDKK